VPVVRLASSEIGQRGERVRKLLSTLSSTAGGPAWQPVAGQGFYIIGAHDGSPPSSEFLQWRFATIAPGFRASYHERWTEQARRSFVLERAYLTIFKVDRADRTETEFVCLHCDPSEPDNAAHAIYKQGPHLHVMVAESPVPHAHIALNRGHLEAVLQSAASLSSALEQSLLMLRKEILDVAAT